MKRTALFVLFLLFSACRVVNDDTTVRAPEAVDSPSPFFEVDSLLQNGVQDQAVRALRRIDPSEYGRMDILWRFVGAYNGRGMTARCIAVLDSLQRNGWGDLTGWKISVLDLNREQQQAVELVPAGDILLMGWLYRDSLEIMPFVSSIHRDALPGPALYAARKRAG